MSSITFPVGAAPAAPAPATRTARSWATGIPLSIGVITAYLSVIVLIPLAAVVFRSSAGGWEDFWGAVTAPQAVAALRLSLIGSFAVAAINAVMGTIIAWVLVRDRVPRQGCGQRADRPPLCAADDRCRADVDCPLRLPQPAGHQRRLHPVRGPPGASLRHPAVRGAGGAAGAGRARPRDGAGGDRAWRERVGRPSA